MPALRHSSDGEPGYTRRRRGRGFQYLDHRGAPVADERTLARIRSLAIPPAWRQVWICRSSRGHLQATGIDAAGRKQYLYHPAWREERERQKHDRILRFAERLPGLREVVDADLRRPGLGRDTALAAAARLLDRANVRVGSEEYKASHGTVGLATLDSRHLTIEGSNIRLDFVGKAGKEHHVQVADPRLARILARMDGLPGREVLKYEDEDGQVVDVRSGDINDYIKANMGEDFTAKDFRTWAGTVAAAVALDEIGPVTSSRARQRALAQVSRTAAELLGNTPAVCRASYIDPRVIDHFLDGRTISQLKDQVEQRLAGGHSAEELAVLALLRRALEDRERAAA